MDEMDYYEEKRIAQNKVRERLDTAKEALKHASTDEERWALERVIHKLEEEWLWAGYTGD